MPLHVRIQTTLSGILSLTRIHRRSFDFHFQPIVQTMHVKTIISLPLTQRQLKSPNEYNFISVKLQRPEQLLQAARQFQK